MNQIISSAEQFQNETLRPILKAQNELLVSLFRHYLQKRKIAFERFSSEDQLAHIEQIIRKDLQFRSLLLGTIVGHLSPAQYLTFLQNEEELNRRTINMLIRRIQSQLVAV
ncbi:MAG: glyoxalase [Bacteroidetes bacterium]|nr:glyoxalase [Bacteroidota bacterium]